MIYTVTMNPAIDCAMCGDVPVAGRVNRVQSQTLRFGGKGINVSYVLKCFGACSVLTGFVGGFSGDALEGGLAGDGFRCDFVHLEKGNTRINVKLTSGMSDGDPDTELNAPGPTPSEDELGLLKNKLSSLTCGDAVVLAGSLPAGIDGSYAAEIAKAIPEGVPFICDLSGDALKCALREAPVFVKPNVHELFDLLGISPDPDNLKDCDLIADSAEKLREMGVKYALITMGEDGAYYIGDVSGFIPAPDFSAEKTGIKSAVGCGDSTVAGWLIGMGYAGDSERETAFDLSGISSDDPMAAAKLAVWFGTASYHFGFPPSPEKFKSIKERNI